MTYLHDTLKYYIFSVSHMHNQGTSCLPLEHDPI